MPELVQQLPDGPIDFIGDVHGELEALQQLLSHLGYQTDGTHPEGRRLVFLGDLVDRGPDSPAVALLVRQLVINGNASCILGNHEMNVLLGKKRTYNRWLGHQKGMPGLWSRHRSASPPTRSAPRFWTSSAPCPSFWSTMP